MAHHGRAGPRAVPSGNVTGGGKSARGRTAQTTKPDPNAGPTPKEGSVLRERLTEVARAIKPGGGKKRGDRRDMHPDPGIRRKRTNQASGLRNDRNPNSVAGRKHNSVPNEGG